MNRYRRLEFIFNPGCGEKVLAFIDFSSHISFGIPQSFSFADHVIKPASENYARITVHEDGRVEAHIPLGSNIPSSWDGRYEPLNSWKRAWSMKQELYWGKSNPFINSLLANPKNSKTSPGTFFENASFPSGTEATTVSFSILRDINDISIIKAIDPDLGNDHYCTYCLEDNWPYILVTIRIHNVLPKYKRIKSVGRDYRII
ncbi:MAG: hypothetical protein PHW65_02475 [Dehalococcoidales bacterium]|nr:hypothetical protein [Dehalococcoidales bacterium]